MPSPVPCRLAAAQPHTNSARRPHPFTALAAPLALLTALTTSLAPRPAAAVDIQVNYDETDRPSFDPTGEKLMAMMDSVKVYYEHLLTNRYSNYDPVFDIEVWWADLPDSSGRLAESQFSGFEIDIVFDTKMLGVGRPWFFDDTPMEDSEFNFAANFGTSSGFTGSGQTLFRDMFATEQQSGYQGSPHSVLEVGYEAFAHQGGPADGKFDLWSTALHEMGHVMAFSPEIYDNDNNYEFYDYQHGGVDAALREDPTSDGHAASKTSLMCEGCGAPSKRRLPSAADLLALGRGIGLQNVNLQRIDYIAGHSDSWTDRLNWIGGQVPDGYDNVFLRNSTPTKITTDGASALNMFVYQDAQLLINGSGDLRVYEELRVGNLANDTRGEVYLGNVSGNPLLDVGSLSIDKGLLNINNQGAVLASRGDVRIRPSGTLMGAGQVEVAGELNNDGKISAGMLVLFTFGGDLYLRGIDGGKLDLDGDSELGQITAVDGNLRIASPLADAFHGTAAVGAGRTMHFFQPWSFGGTLVMQGSEAKPAQLVGAEIQFGGAANIETGVNFIGAPLVAGSSAQINVRPGARLNLYTGQLGAANNPTAYAGEMLVEDYATLDVDVPGTSWTNDGTMQLKFGGVGGDDLVNNGRIEGAGTFNLARVENRGVVAPGAVLLNPYGNYVQTAAGRLEIDLAGLAQGVSFDVLRASGVELDGTLAVKLADDFLPAVGVRFDVVMAQALTGDFSSFELETPDDVQFSVEMFQRFNPNNFLTTVSLLVTQAHFAADFDYDGDVDGGDMTAWMSASNAGVLGPNGAGDADGDLDADGADMLIVQRQLGRRVVSRPNPLGGDGGVGAVPEPTTSLLAMGALATVVAARRRRD